MSYQLTSAGRAIPPAGHAPGRGDRRPDMRAYFAARIDQYVNGMMSRTIARRPNEVAWVDGDVTDARITVTMRNGAQWHWAGGRYAARKVNGCYAPLMPKPVAQ